MVVIRGRLTPKVGAVVQGALEAAADRQFRDAAQARTGDQIVEEITPAQRHADALGLLAEVALSADLDAGTTGDRCQVVVHVSAETPTGRPVDREADDTTNSESNAALELDHGALGVSAETSRRLACDASVVRIDYDAAGAVLDVGRKTRTIPPSIRRALAARDRGCRRGARHDAATPTTWSTGRTADRPASTICCSCAAVTTAPSTKADSA